MAGPGGGSLDQPAEGTLSRTVVRRRLALVVLGAAVALALSGCAPSMPSYDETTARALELRDEVVATIPDDAVVESNDDEVRVSCGGDAAQLDFITTVSLDEGFDRVAWLDATAADFEARGGWTVEKMVAADGSSDATSAVAAVSEDLYYLRFDEFSDTSGGTPVLVVSASSLCAYE